MLENILKNPSLEEPYVRHGADELQVAEGWTLTWREGEPVPHPDAPQDSDHFCARPEYEAISHLQAPYRVLSGDTAQKAVIRWKIMDACIMQKAQVPVGRLLTLRAMVHAWCSDSDDPQAHDQELYFCLGLDLEDGVNPFRPAPPSILVWSDWTLATNKYQEIELAAQATHPYVNAIIRFWNKRRNSHNDAYIDDVKLLVNMDDQPPTPGPTDAVSAAQWVEIFRKAADVLDKSQP